MAAEFALEPAIEPDALPADFIRGCLEAESEGDGLLFDRLFADRVRYSVNESAWYVWSGTCWRRDEKRLVFAAISHVVDCYGRLLLELAAENQSATPETAEALRRASAKKAQRIERRIKYLRGVAGRNACLEFAWQGRPVAVNSSAFNADPWKLGVPNGVVDLRTGMLLKATPDDMITRQCGCPYVPWDDLPQERQDEVWAFFDQIFDNDREKIGFVQRLLGQALVGKVICHVFPFWLGRRGRNGKSSLCNLLLHILGDYGITFRHEMLFEQFGASASGIDPDMVDLDGARLAISSEVRDGAVFSAQRIKLLTGGDKLKGRKPFEDFRTFTPSHSLIMLGNHEPTAPSGDDAFWSRTFLIYFPMRFVPDPDPAKKELPLVHNYEDKLKENATAFLAWMVRGCLEFQMDGCRLRPPESVLKVTEAYKDDSDWMGQFLAACTERRESAEIRSSTLYNAFALWYAENINNNRKFLPSQTKFSKKMRELGEFQKIHNADGNYFRGLELSAVWERRAWENEEAGA